MQLRVVRVERYLKNNSRLVWKFPSQQQQKSIDVFVDADFAARETMLRSTSGVAEYYGFASSTQGVRALSTGESEFCAISSAHSLHSQAILKGFGVTVEAVVEVALGAGDSFGHCLYCHEIPDTTPNGDAAVGRQSRSERRRGEDDVYIVMDSEVSTS